MKSLSKIGLDDFKRPYWLRSLSPDFFSDGIKLYCFPMNGAVNAEGKMDRITNDSMFKVTADFAITFEI